MAAANRPALFSNKPAWLSSKKTSIPTQEDEQPIFGRDKQTYLEILAASQQKKEARAKARVERHENDHRSSKRRRTAGSSDEQESGHETPVFTSASEQRASPETDYESRPATRSTRRKEKQLLDGLEGKSRSRNVPSQSKHATTPTITVDSDDDVAYVSASKTDDVEVQFVETKSKPNTVQQESQQQNISSESDEEDEYVRELKRRARQKARALKTNNQPEKSSAATPDLCPTADEISKRTTSTSEAPQPETKEVAATRPSPDDPIVEILVTSSIPNSRPLVVRRHASQPLQQVKQYWCDAQKFEKEFAARVFFTWRGTKLFNSTTMRGVLQTLKNEAGQDQSFGKIVLEAMTPDIYEQGLKEKERENAKKAAGFADSFGDQQNGSERMINDNDTQESDPSGGQQKQESIVIKLKAEGYEEMILRVRQNTSVDKIMRGFQKTRQVDSTKRCWLVFDGERLEPDALVSDVGFENQDEVEVHPR